ncbi:transposable element Tcb2 transposase [Trichonephila clavipes]|nr:transposable element Tcb2 transposase [Trichonephila clavipes]
MKSVKKKFWNSVIFSDESKFNIYESDGHQKVWRKANAALEPKNMRGTVKHGGGSFMVWDCMPATEVGNLAVIDGIMNQYNYLNILKNNLSQSASKLGLDRSFTFQQDNDPKHTARVVREWLPAI